MGVTIHFEGQLKSEQDYDTVLQTAINFAGANNMSFSIIAEENKLLERVRNEEDWNYQGPVKGIRILPDESTDPLWLEFDENLYVQNFCKTQFAHLEIHIKIVEFFEAIQNAFDELLIYDEGDFWDTHDSQVLREHLTNCFAQMERAKQENPKVDGLYRFENGRFIDLIEE